MFEKSFLRLWLNKVLENWRKLARSKYKLQWLKASPPKSFISCTWTPSLIIFQLATGPLAMANVPFLVAYADLAAKKLLVALPIFQHLGVDTKTLLGEKHDVLDGIDCSSVLNISTVSRGGYACRLMVSRLNNLTSSDSIDKSDSDHQLRVNYYDFQKEEGPFPDPTLLDPVDIDQHQDVLDEFKDIIQMAIDNRFSEEKFPELREIILDHTDIFRVSFSSGPQAKLPPQRFFLCQMRLLFVSNHEITLKNNTNFFQAFGQILSIMEWPILTSPHPGLPLRDWSTNLFLSHFALLSIFALSTDLQSCINSACCFSIKNFQKPQNPKISSCQLVTGNSFLRNHRNFLNPSSPPTASLHWLEFFMVRLTPFITFNML